MQELVLLKNIYLYFLDFRIFTMCDSSRYKYYHLCGMDFCIINYLLEGKLLTTKGKILSMMISLATFLANLVKISVAFTLAPQNFKLLTCEVTNPQIIVNPEKS